ncbi:hypothetical protein RKE29_29955, partial [Streptomyces sp. B1866]|nr:hypothetical protein [Streptomyces sp. B1866]
PGCRAAEVLRRAGADPDLLAGALDAAAAAARADGRTPCRGHGPSAAGPPGGLRPEPGLPGA